MITRQTHTTLTTSYGNVNVTITPIPGMDGVHFSAILNGRAIAGGAIGNGDLPKVIAEITEMVMATFGLMLQEVTEIQYLIVKAGGMAIKSKVEDVLMFRWPLDRAMAHELTNTSESTANDFRIGGCGDTRWQAARPEPVPGKYPELSAVFPKLFPVITPEPDDVTPATDEAIAAELYRPEEERRDFHTDDLPAWLENDTEAANRNNEGPCVFCVRAGINPPADGGAATGSYRPAGLGVERSVPFRGFVCDMHREDVDWVNFSWR